VATPTLQASVATTASPAATASTTAAKTPIEAANPDAAKNPQAALPPNSRLRRIGEFPMKVGPAVIPTPTPEPFKPRPTPTVVMEDGKIKQQWQAPAEAASLTNPVKDRANAAQIGRELYLQRCSDCHGREGKGNGYMSALLKRDGKRITPTNLASQMVQANTDGELFWKITNGKSPMPASRVRFDDEQRWYIVTFLRTLK
jgi:mono/diheme cytochrome c family protein